jgi:pyruvate,orthophosphate dikinase
MVRENLIDKKEAIMRVKPEQLDQLLHPMLDPKAKKDLLARGLPASPGAATGQIVFDPGVAEKWVKDMGRKVILVRTETSPEDIHGMSVSEGILTARGGMTSHAAVVARGMGKCCVAGCSALRINTDGTAMIGTRTLKEGDYITLDGSSGEIIAGRVATIAPSMNKDFQELMTWVDEMRKLRVRANADTPHDARVARTFGAEGIGLCRTEHMFFEQDRIDAVREMILSDSKEGRERALAKILPMQKSDFLGIFREMRGLPVTIRLLDPPLHEFLPHTDEEIRTLANKIGVAFEKLKRKKESLHEFNPMLGHRGCRLGISFPEIYITQVRAIMEAACELAKNEGLRIVPEIMIPLVGDWRELKIIRDYTEKECKATMSRYGTTLEYKVGTMIELPRAALTADEIAQYAEFFSFGTNDLTQTTYGLSRDDSGLFLRDYLDAKIYEKDPFVTLDQTGVGKLIKMSLELGRGKRKDLKIGICGEHGGDPASVEFCHRTGLDYVSCSPYRVPIARLAAAQASLIK